MPLTPEVRTAAACALRALFPVWLALPITDYRRMHRPQGGGGYYIDIQPYRGSSTMIGFLRHLDDSAEARKLAEAIANYQPELTSFLILPSQAIRLPDCRALIVTWCRALESTEANRHPADAQIAKLLDEFSALLDRRTLTLRITTSITGLRLPAETFRLSLDEGVTLRTMSGDELAELSSQDITFGQDQDIMRHAVSSCLEFEGSVPFSLEPTHQNGLPPSTFERDARDYTTDVLRALHVLRSGRAGVFMTTEMYIPQLLPGIGQGSSWPLQRHPFASFQFFDLDVDAFTAILRSFRSGVRDEIRIAADRLVDAESRLSPVDSLLDAAIGLEALLNPMDASELSFRVALNYAYLATTEHRRERYEHVRTIQKTRNRVVHGGLNLQSSDAPMIWEHADLAKACLRDAIRCCLLDPTFAGTRRLDADFWLDRMLPANDVGVRTRPRPE